MGPMVGMLGAAQAQMALAVLIGIHPSPLGQILRFDGLRPSTFRFDGVAEPQSGPRFVARTDLTPQDLVIELRDATEAPVPAVPWAVRNGVQLVKNTSLASVVGFLELTRSAQVINNSLFEPFLVFGIAAVLYFAVCYPLSLWSRILERKLNAGRRQA